MLKKYSSMLKKEIEYMVLALESAIRTDNPLTIGLVVGQVLQKMKELSGDASLVAYSEDE